MFNQTDITGRIIANYGMIERLIHFSKLFDVCYPMDVHKLHFVRRRGQMLEYGICLRVTSYIYVYLLYGMLCEYMDAECFVEMNGVPLMVKKVNQEPILNVTDL